ncbi:RNA methyltransferase [Micrococcus sp.]|uniref:TrmH family RNA methyltransferase n=1 Tax=Micrococcus sp. TaxID=1271 RepID=UPI0026DD4DD5|nr:RNA methyltransferase [Micrococcus sp.]MDO4239951.1 RNA methyltransferase [Micrococcus sp.]
MTRHTRPPVPSDVMDNPRAERVRAVAALAGRAARRRSGTFLVEGPQGCREALRAHLGEGPERARRQWRPGQVLTQVFVAPDLAWRDPELGELVARVHGLEGPDRVLVREATDEVLTAMTDAVTAQGIVAVARVPELLPAEELWRDARLAAVLCRVQDPGNAGTVLRAADAAGADAVVLTTGSVDPFGPKVVRSTAGSLFHLPVLTGAEAGRTAADARAAGLQVWAADGYGTDRLDRLDAAAVAGPTAWLFGNEAQGLDDAELALADRRVAVPLYGAAESLNVATAATVCLYASAMAAPRPE